jgi:transcriptional regulator with XRE-family HTH domain
VGAEQRNSIGDIVKQQRTSIPMTLQQLAKRANVSASHLGRIERGERFPSARILRRIAAPLGFEENELFMLAGYLSSLPSIAENGLPYSSRQLDPLVARLLSREPIEVQRQVISILAILKSLSRNINASTVENKGK